MLRTRQLASAIAATLLFSSAAIATDFSKVVVFGDSLSDSGNLSQVLPGPSIQPPLRFTTNPGTVAIENVAHTLGNTLSPSLNGGTDYAWGGAGVNNNSPGTPGAVPTLTAQVNAYLGAGSADQHALYSIWGGANDIFYHATLAGGGLETSAQAQGGIAAAAQQEVKLIGQLQAAGVKNILVFNLPDIGLTPSAAAQGPAAAASLTGLSLIFNNQLNSGLGQLGTGIIPINAYGLLSEVIASPQAYGFSNATTAACGITSSSVRCGPQGSGLPYTYAAGTDQSYVFADGAHPTTGAHAMLGQYVVSVIRAPEQISLLGEAPLAANAAQTRAIRSQMLVDGASGETRTFVNIDYGRQRFDASNGSPKTNSNNFNLTLGAAVQATDHLSAGVALGVGQANASFSGGGGYKLQDISGLGYVTYHAGGGYIGGYANFGQSNFKDIERRIDLGAMQRTESGKTDGSHLGTGFTGGWWFDFDNLRTGPFANLEWQTVKINGYSESGNDSTAMWFGKQQRDALVATLGWRLQGHWDVGNTVLSPYAELAWNHDDKADPRTVSAGLNSMNGTFALTGFTPDKNWGTAELGVSAKLTPSMTSWFGYSGRFSDTSQKYNSLNMGFKVMF
ncbi:autotransporter domain-containing protein [Rhodanobacter glycinis]|uniref:Autotransporter domain-containing protein n=1 Tax=Rhodanobacter glycinis TaxID=582702 RepID=A0A502CF62_9GAMM|nr:autotransporter domain-containing protein [Rhodanobacter glycinis]TPG11423.1 autotransporter domain-containing protein [Rhodanobacter glycinis]TPG46840.1 autotransporter domain-containing protein [Rhodanobacter glycinis]